LKLFYEKFPANDKKDDESIQELVTKTIEAARIRLKGYSGSIPTGVIRLVTVCSTFLQLFSEEFDSEDTNEDE
jgi:hypothetical protein